MMKIKYRRPLVMLRSLAALALSFATFYAAQLALVNGAVWLIDHKVSGLLIALALIAGWILILKLFTD
ncbi:MAG: hypothetical protein WAV20_04320 [Blastocatellia bacterium]